MPIYLVLHGYLQSGQIIKQELSNFFSSDTILFAPDGPLRSDDDKYAWFSLNITDITSAVDRILSYDFLRNHSNKFDAIIAFEQGCLAAVLLLGSRKIVTSKLIVFNPTAPPSKWKYIVPSGVHCRLYFGIQDFIVKHNDKFAILTFLGHNIVEISQHPWGHIIPATIDYIQDYNQFLQT